MRNIGGLTLRILLLDEYAGGGNGLVTATVTLNCIVAPANAGTDAGWLAPNFRNRGRDTKLVPVGSIECHDCAAVIYS